MIKHLVVVDAFLALVEFFSVLIKFSVALVHAAAINCI